MKKNGSVVALSFLVVFLFVFSIAPDCFPKQPDSKVWEFFKDGWYYNKQNMTKSSGIIKVWTYSIITDDVRKKRLANIKQKEETKKYSNYDHFMLLNKVDCQKRTIKLEEAIDYDSNGKVLNRIVNKNSQWGFIEPASSMDVLYEKICTPPAKPLKKK